MNATPSEIDIWVTISIRLVNFILWAILCLRIARQKRPVYGLVRGLIMSVIFLGMGVLFFGSLSSLDIFQPGTARMAYTIFTAYAGLVALTLLFGDISPPDEE